MSRNFQRKWKTYFFWNEEDAKKDAENLTKYYGYEFVPIKCEPFNKSDPEKCWGVKPK